MVEEIIIIIIITFHGTEIHSIGLWYFSFFGLGERRTVSNVPELPELSHEV
jgi:hypothetical protein